MEIKAKVEDWFMDKNLNNPRKQFFKLIEEYGELVAAILKNDIDEVKDAIGDMQVVIIGLGLMTETHVPLFDTYVIKAYDIDNELIKLHDELNCLNLALHGESVSNYSDWYGSILSRLNNIAELYDTTPRECLELAYDEIKDRTGETKDGVFVKTKEKIG